RGKTRMLLSARRQLLLVNGHQVIKNPETREGVLWGNHRRPVAASHVGELEVQLVLLQLNKVNGSCCIFQCVTEVVRNDDAFNCLIGFREFRLNPSDVPKNLPDSLFIGSSCFEFDHNQFVLRVNGKNVDYADVSPELLPFASVAGVQLKARSQLLKVRQ